ALSGATNPDSLVMDDDKEVMASFTQLPEGQCELRVTVNGAGTVQMDPPGPYYPTGTVVVLTAQPTAGNTFSEWSGAASGNELRDTVTVNTHMSVTATFRQLMAYGVRARAATGGTVTLDPPGSTQLEGTKIAVEAVPAEGWEFVGWAGALQGTTTPDTVLMSGAREVKARFRKTGSQLVPLAPVEDSYVRGSLYNTRNFDSDSLLRVREGGADLYRCRAYLQFDLSSITGTLLQASLLLHSRVTNAFPNGTPVNVFACRTAGDSWTETALTWKNVPAEGTTADSTMYLACENSIYSWDLTVCVSEELAGDKRLTVLLKDQTMQDKTAYFDARETAFAPVLEVETETGPDAVAAGEARPAVFRLEQNYPNPFNPKTVVSSQLPVVSNVKLVVYDVLGREVAVLVDGKREAGTYHDAFDGSGLASGVYVCRLTAGTYVESRSMCLVK
ncbi:T9SS C-terminal target domain-containing protein, partial [bacterium]